MKKWISMTLVLVLVLSALPIWQVSAATEDSDTTKITLLSMLEIMTGDPDGNFRLDDPVSRAEFAKIAIAASSHKDLVAIGAPVSPFSDVPYTHWAAPYVLLAVNNGIVKGYTDATFRPDGTVTYEEAVTMLLNLLGYTDSDFGLAWPYGQMAVAKSIGLLDGMTATVGEPLDRADAMALVYQILYTPSKNQTADYIETLGYTRVEDVVLIATAEEEVSVGAGKILTSSGTYRIDESYDGAQTGRRGDIILKDKDQLALFIPDEQQTETYLVYQILSDDIMVMENGTLSALDLGNSLTVYHEGKGTTLSALKSTLTVGDTLTVYQDSRGTPDYATLSTEDLVGPITVTDSSWLASIGLSNPEITKNGQRVTAADIAANDIIYYSKALNRVFAYRKQITGIFEKALPNRDQPTSIVVSGTTYAIEGAHALEQFSSGSGLNLGETVTLLLGKSDAVVDVVRPQESIVGYLTGTGTKSYETADSTGIYTGYYASVMLPNGDVYEYITDVEYDDDINKVVTVQFANDGKVALSRYRQTEEYSGEVKAEKNRIGTYEVAANIEILDVSTTEAGKTALTTTVYLTRLNGVQLQPEDILYIKFNDQNQIAQLILNNKTGDMFDYVFITKAVEETDRTLMGQYTYLKNGVSQTSTSSNKVFAIKSNTAAQMTLSANGGLEKLTALRVVPATVIELTQTHISAGGKSYPVSDSVVVYQKTAQREYSMIPIQEINAESGIITAYYDKEPTKGGRVRIIIVE